MRSRSLVPLLLVGCLVRVYVDEETRVIGDPFDELVVDADAGDVRVHGTDSSDATIDARIERNRSEPTLTTQVRDGVLEVVAECPRPRLYCRVDLDIAVPKDTTVTIETGAGDVDVTRIEGPLEASTGAGDVGLADLTSPLNVDTGAGRIVGDRLASSETTARTGSGRIDVAFVVAPDLVDVQTGSGAIDLLLPDDTYDVDLQTGVGDVDVHGITIDDDATKRIRASTGVGDITLVGFVVGTSR